MNAIKKSKLYDKSKVIRIGVVNDSGALLEDAVLEDPKFEVVYGGKSEEYERATLYHMRKSCETDDESTIYYYLHTKGLRHFGTPDEPNVIDWIHLMLFWNIEKWELAVDTLKSHDTYGCNFCNSNHYSGNFWWATALHVRKLPSVIGPRYNDPEDWVYSVKTRGYSCYQSGLEGMGHYWHRYPRECYEHASGSVNCIR